MIGAEEEKLILRDSPSDGSSILVLSDDRLLLSGLIEEKVVRIQSFVPEELEGRTVEVILPGFRNDVYVRPGIPPKRSVGLAGLHLEFCDGVRVGHRGASGVAAVTGFKIVGINTVELEAVIK